MNIRKEFWFKSKELIEWCSDNELHMLKKQSESTLEKRINAYAQKIDNEDRLKKKRKQNKIKSKVKSK